MQLQPLWQRELFSGPHRVHAFYRSPSPPPPPAQAVGDLQGSEVRGREERQAFLLLFSQEWKGKCLCARKCQERIDWRGEKNICISRHMHTHEYFKIQGLHPVQMLNLNPQYIMLALLSPCNRLQPRFLFVCFFCSMQQMRCKRRCLWEGRTDWLLSWWAGGEKFRRPHTVIWSP